MELQINPNNFEEAVILNEDNEAEENFPEAELVEVEEDLPEAEIVEEYVSGNDSVFGAGATKILDSGELETREIKPDDIYNLKDSRSVSDFKKTGGESSFVLLKEQAEKDLRQSILKIDNLDLLSQNEVLKIAQEVFKKSQERNLPQDVSPVGDFKKAGNLWNAENKLEEHYEGVKKDFDILANDLNENKVLNETLANKTNKSLQTAFKELFKFLKEYGAEDINTATIKKIILNTSQYVKIIRNAYIKQMKRAYENKKISVGLKREIKQKALEVLKIFRDNKEDFDKYIQQNPEIVKKIPELSILLKELSPKKARECFKEEQVV